MKEYIAFLKSLIERQLDDPGNQWFQEQNQKIEENRFDDFEFDVAFGLASRKLGKDDLNLTENDLNFAESLRKGFNPCKWSIDIALRIYIILRFTEGNKENFITKFKQLHKFADGQELIALFSGLPLFEHSEELTNIVTNALRTNVKSEFESIAHYNPYPFEQFDHNAWNNMVLKSLFIGAMLNPIFGLDTRANLELAKILKDYANERWAAKRFVSPELWRCVGPFAEEYFLSDLKRVLTTGLDIEKKAVALSLAQSKDKKVKHELNQYVKIYENDIKEGNLNWEFIEKDLIKNSLSYTQRLNIEETV